MQKNEGGNHVQRDGKRNENGREFTAEKRFLADRK